MSEITGTRLLRKQIPYCWVYGVGEEPNQFEIGVQGGGWEIYTNELGRVYAIWRGYFDIAGWNSEQLTAFISGAGFQEANQWLGPDPVALGSIPRIKTWDIVSKAKIPNSALDTATALTSGEWLAPGFAGSNYDLEEIFTGRYRHFDYSTTVTAGFNQTAMQIWGAGDATAGDKVYLTRVVDVSGVLVYPGFLIIPPQNVVMPATLVDEKDLVYMERLRRSYVLAESRNP